MSRYPTSSLVRLALSFAMLGILPLVAYAEKASAEEKPFALKQEMFGMRLPREDEHAHFGHVGVTGLELRFKPGRVLYVERVLPDTPADGLLAPGDVITGVNGMPLEGHNPYIVLGANLSEAEATDGKLVFEVRAEDEDDTRAVSVEIPVFGSYSETWPLDCEKTDAIVARAAEYYANRTLYAYGDANDERRPDSMETHGVSGALAALFLLSTGDDQYLPRVREYVAHLADDVEAIGTHTWDNGYNGIVVAEYYLRTGDEIALPVLQFFADDARDRQYFGAGWNHWGRDINPNYVAGGLMNPAGAQVLTTLLLAKECGVDVDEDTLHGALRFWYRFVGRGSVPYGDHRGEGGLGSNGKDGMAAAIMQVASGAQGNTEIYQQARDHLGMATLNSYPRLVAGHGDHGRGDGIWRGVASAYRLEDTPEQYHGIMNHLRWWLDLSRRPNGSIGMAMNPRFDDVGSGAGVALAYTAPRRTLRITGAPPSEHANPFRLPETLWGREADRAFHDTDHGEPYYAHGEPEPIHIPFRKLGNAYSDPDADLEAMGADIRRNMYHASYVIRTQAGKALLRKEAFEDLESFLEDPDPRVRRAALDGLTDYRYWHHFGRNPASSENISSNMLTSVSRMLTDPEEAWYVVDGALMVLSLAEPEVVKEHLSIVLPWTDHDEWWIRQSAFHTLRRVAENEEYVSAVLPTMVDMFNNEERTQPRMGMQRALAQVLQRTQADSDAARKAFEGLQQAVVDTPIREAPRSGEGQYYVVQAALTALRQTPEKALVIANAVQERFAVLRAQDIEAVTDKLLEIREELTDDTKSALTDLLASVYRKEFLAMMKKDAGSVSLDTVISLVQLDHPDVDWQMLGEKDYAERVWQFTSFDPAPEDQLADHIGRRYREIKMPDELVGWNKNEYDASDWESGRAPIGKGEFRGRGPQGEPLDNRSDWGDGEFLVMRGEFELANPSDYDFFRLRVLANQGFRIYLNGYLVHTYTWWNTNPQYRAIGLAPEHAEHFRAGSNLLAIYANAAIVDGEQIGQVDVYMEGLRKSDLLNEAEE